MAYKNEKRFKKIYISDGSTVLPNSDFFYGPYDSLGAAVEYINDFCEEIGVDVPLGITIAIYTSSDKLGIVEYLNSTRDRSGFCSVSNFELKKGGTGEGGSYWFEK